MKTTLFLIGKIIGNMFLKYVFRIFMDIFRFILIQNRGTLPNILRYPIESSVWKPLLFSDLLIPEALSLQFSLTPCSALIYLASIGVDREMAQVCFSTSASTFPLKSLDFSSGINPSSSSATSVKLPLNSLPSSSM